MGVHNQYINGTYASYLAIDIMAGYTVLDTKKFSITPRVGIYWGSYGWNVANYENVDGVEKITSTESPSIRDFNWKAAIDFDFHFSTIVSKNPFFLTQKR